MFHLSISQSHVFLVNSRLGLFSAPPLTEGPLIPKLRGHFAEFLGHESLEHLRILSSPTCVGLRYGLYTYFTLRRFSWKSVYHNCRRSRGIAVLSGLGIAGSEPRDMPTPFNQLFRPLAYVSLLRLSSAYLYR